MAIIIRGPLADPRSTESVVLDPVVEGEILQAINEPSHATYV